MTETTQSTDNRLEAELERYLKIFSNDPKSRVFAPLGEIYRKLGKLDEAIEVLLEGIKVHPNYPSGHLSLGRCYGDKGDSKKAIEEYRAVIKHAPDNLMAHKLLASETKKIGDENAVAEVYQKILKLSPQDEDALKYLESKGLLKKEEPPKPKLPKKESPIVKEDKAIEEKKTADSPKAPSPSPFEDEPTQSGFDLGSQESNLNEDEDILVPSKDTENTDIMSPTNADNIPPLGDFVSASDEETDEHDVAPTDKFRFYTATLAEIYVKQGLKKEAVEIYEFLVNNDPRNKTYKAKLDQLKGEDKKEDIPILKKSEESGIEAKEPEAMEPAIEPETIIPEAQMIKEDPVDTPKEAEDMSTTDEFSEPQEDNSAMGEEISVELPIQEPPIEKRPDSESRIGKLNSLLKTINSNKRLL